MKKVVIGCGAVLVLLAVIAAGAFVWWRKTGGPERLKAWGTRLQAEGAALGSSKGDVACVDESLARMGACGGSICRGGVAAVFAGACLEHSDRSKELCDSIPDRHGSQLAEWAKRYCAAKGDPPDRCVMLSQFVWSHCRAEMHRVAAPAPPN